MNVPGANILLEALELIGPEDITYFPYIKRTKLPNGLYSMTYGDGQCVQGSVQPIPRTLYSDMGLDFQKDYYLVFLPLSVLDITRGVSGDQFQWQGKNLQARSKVNWFGIDGWDQILCVKVAKF